MKTPHPGQRGNTLVITISVVAAILVLLGSAVGYTQHVSRVADRSRKTALAVEIADGHLEYLFTNWRNIYRTPALRYSFLPTNYFFTSTNNPGPPPTAGATPTTGPTPWPGVPPVIPTPAPSNFPSVGSYTVDKYEIQAVTPMIELGANEKSILGVTTPPSAAYGPNSYQYSFFYLASVDISVPVMNGSVKAKVRRIFEKKFDNPWTYAMFYADDLELNPTNPLTITGPIQTNGNLYIGTDKFTAQSKVSYSGSYVNGFSPDDTSSHAGGVSAPNFATDLPPMQEAPYLPFGWNLKLDNADGSKNNDSYHELIEQPAAEGTNQDPIADYRFYNQAAYRVLIAENNSITITQYNTSTKTSTNINSGSAYNAIVGAITTNQAIQDQREGKYVRLTSLDVSKITTAVNNGTLSGWNGVLYIADNTTNGNSVTSKIGGSGTSVPTTERGIRLINGATLPSNGLTIASLNPVYIQGNYNTGGSSPLSNSGTPTSPTVSGYTRKKAAVIGDSINVLSGAWSDFNSTQAITSRIASAITVNAALVGGIVPSGGGNYSGGGENFIRLQEDWKNAYFTYYGSMVQLYASVQGNAPSNALGQLFKSPKNAYWFWDTNFGSGSPPDINLQISAYLQQQRWYQVY